MPSTLTSPQKPSARGQRDLKYGYEAASQTFQPGDFLKMDSAERLEIAAAASNDVGTVLIAGRAVAPASGVTNARVPYMRADNDTEWLVPVYHATPASAVTSQDLVGKVYNLRNQAGVWCIHIDAASGATPPEHCMVTDLGQDHPAGEAYGYVWIKIVATSRLFG